MIIALTEVEIIEHSKQKKNLKCLLMLSKSNTFIVLKKILHWIRLEFELNTLSAYCLGPKNFTIRFVQLYI